MFLGPGHSPVYAWLLDREEMSEPVIKPLCVEHYEAFSPEIVVSHGYRHIVSSGVLSLASGRFINLHIGYLPFNRGADPNFWSFAENTQPGVTIHIMDEGLDTGDIIAQKPVVFGPDETLATSYDLLQSELLDLFCATWPGIRAGTCPRKPQSGLGSCHRQVDIEPYRNKLVAGWDTPITAIQGVALLNPRLVQPGDYED